MTIIDAKQKLVNWLNSQVGYHEALDGSNKYGADGDWDLKLYGFDGSNVAWCDLFVDYAFIHVFGYDLGTKMTFQDPKGYALCRWSAEAYQNNGHWFMKPEIGDQIFFYYGGEINHTGLVVAVNGDNITCVEGNFSDSVSRTYYNWRISNQIAGYGRPNWSIVTGKADEKPETAKPEEKTEETMQRAYLHLQNGDGMNAPSAGVKAWQNLLLCWGFSLAPYGADGEFGSATQNATIQFQQKVGLTPNGIVDEESWKQAIYIG